MTKLNNFRFDKIKTVYGYYANRHVLGTYPMQVAIELTNRCNLKCVMCPHDRMTRSQGNMSEELFKKIIDQLQGKSEFVYLYGMGESMLHPQFFSLADYAVQSGLTTSLSTNITLLNEEKSRKLLESGIDFIVLPLDGAGKDSYESVRVGGKFEKNVERIKTLLRIKRELNAKAYVDIQYIVLDEANQMGHVEDLFTEEEKSVVNMFRKKPVLKSPSITTEEINHQHPCYFLWSTMDISWDGRVSLCCMDYDTEVVFGDLSKTSIWEVWNSEEMADYRRMHKNLEYSKMPICNKCLLPEKKYFSDATILASSLLSAGTLRRLLPVYEKIISKKNG